MIGVIYKIVNHVTNQHYIGFTKDFEAREEVHFRALRNRTHTNVKMQKSYNMYGREAFSMKVIENVNSYQDVSARENYWISAYNTLIDGFNQRLSGGAWTRPVKTISKRASEIKAVRESVGVSVWETAQILELPKWAVMHIEIEKPVIVEYVGIVENFFFGLELSSELAKVNLQLEAIRKIIEGES